MARTKSKKQSGWLFAATCAAALLCAGCDLAGKKYTVEYDVTFNANGGVFADSKATQVVRVEAKSKIDEVPPVSAQGKDFIKWTDEKDGEEALAHDFTQLVTEDITLYAQWKEAEKSVQFSGLSQYNNDSVMAVLLQNKPQSKTGMELLLELVQISTSGTYVALTNPVKIASDNVGPLPLLTGATSTSRPYMGRGNYYLLLCVGKSDDGGAASPSDIKMFYISKNQKAFENHINTIAITLNDFTTIDPYVGARKLTVSGLGEEWEGKLLSVGIGADAAALLADAYASATLIANGGVKDVMLFTLSGAAFTQGGNYYVQLSISEPGEDGRPIEGLPLITYKSKAAISISGSSTVIVYNEDDWETMGDFQSFSRWLPPED